MIDHTGVNVSDFEASRAFYAAALAPLGYELLLEFDASVTSFVPWPVSERLESWISGSVKAKRTRRGFMSPSEPILIKRSTHSTTRR